MYYAYRIVDVADNCFSYVLFLQIQEQQQPEFYAAHESRSGRQLLQLANDDKPLCNITEKLLLYVENITIWQDGKLFWEIGEGLQCPSSAAVCQDNSTVYVIFTLEPFL